MGKRKRFPAGDAQFPSPREIASEAGGIDVETAHEIKRRSGSDVDAGGRRIHARIAGNAGHGIGAEVDGETRAVGDAEAAVAQVVVVGQRDTSALHRMCHLPEKGVALAEAKRAGPLLHERHRGIVETRAGEGVEVEPSPVNADVGLAGEMHPRSIRRTRDRPHVI